MATIKMMNIAMDNACTARILNEVCKKANLKLETKYDIKRRCDVYSIEHSEFMKVGEAMAKAIFECELNGQWIENFGIKTRNGFPVFLRVA